MLQLTITDIDQGPGDLYEQVPLVVDLIRELPGNDRPDYWLGSARKPIRWLVENHFREVTHVVLAARWQGTRIEEGVEHLPVGIAFVTDHSILDDTRFDLTKCQYVAIGTATETGNGTEAKPLTEILSGTIARAFGVGKPG